MNNSFEDDLKSKYWEKFKAIFNTNILPQLSEIEKLRKIKIVQFFIICILLLVGMISLGIFMAYDDYNHNHIGSFKAGLFMVFSS